MPANDVLAVGLGVLVLLAGVLALRAWLTARSAVERADDAVNRWTGVAAERLFVAARADQIGKTLAAGTTAVALGTDVVQTTHNLISDSVFGLLDAIPATKEQSAVVKGIHDATSEGVYTAISEVNKAVGGLLKGITDPGARDK